jgi:phosphatidylglycerol---prolipoprotein diacylglyceryl transferase
MCSELFRIPVEWAGVPIFGFGVLLLLWLAMGLLWMVRIGRTQGWTDAWNLLAPMAVGAAVIWILPTMFPGGLPIRGYGVMVLSGSVLAIGLAIHQGERLGIDPEQIMTLAFWMFALGIVGARIFYVIEYWESRFAMESWSLTLKEIVNFPQGGLVIYGALIGACIAFVLYCYRYRQPPLALADLIAPSMMAGLALGRIGCLLNGCCYGGETDRPWAVTFPRDSVPYIDQIASGRLFGFQLAELIGRKTPLEVCRVDPGSPAAISGLTIGASIVSIGGLPVQNAQQAQGTLLNAYSRHVPLELRTADGQTYHLPPFDPDRSLPIHPTQIYSAINAGLLSWLLWSWFPFRRRDGEVIGLMMILYPISRFLLEIIRTDESAVFGTGLSISQNISLVMLVGAVGLWFYLLHQPSTDLREQNE